MNAAMCAFLRFYEIEHARAIALMWFANPSQGVALSAPRLADCGLFASKVVVGRTCSPAWAWIPLAHALKECRFRRALPPNFGDPSTAMDDLKRPFQALMDHPAYKVPLG